MDAETRGSRNNGGAAFPAIKDLMKHEGMSLRDWFAGQALVGLLTHPDGYTGTLAQWAYAHADAMLRAREAK